MAANSLTLSWAPSTDGTPPITYQPQVRVTGSTAWVQFGSPILGTSVTITGLSPATNYDFDIIASNIAGSATSAVATGATSSSGVVRPSPPTSVVITPSPNPVLLPTPDPAAVVGYNTLTFGPAITLGTDPTLNQLNGNWLPCNFNGIAWQSLVVGQNGDGSISLPPNIINTIGAQISTASYNPTATPYMRGVAFGGGMYAEVTMAWIWNGTSGGPMFWCGDIESTMGSSANDLTLRQWPSQAVGYGDWIEWDIARYDQPSLGGALNGQDGFALHNFYGSTNPPSHVDATGSGSPAKLPAGVDFSQPHRYGGLWVPATNTAQGYVKWFFDGIQVGSTITWNKYNAALAPPPVDTGFGGSSAYSIIDQRHLVLILGNAPTVSGVSPSTLTVYSVAVWQASAASNIMK